jgi:hypothetical protein
MKRGEEYLIPPPPGRDYSPMSDRSSDREEKKNPSGFFDGEFPREKILRP